MIKKYFENYFKKIGRNRWIKITQEGKDVAEFLI
jgi:hypothetical protein